MLLISNNFSFFKHRQTDGKLIILEHVFILTGQLAGVHSYTVHQYNIVNVTNTFIIVNTSEIRLTSAVFHEFAKFGQTKYWSLIFTAKSFSCMKLYANLFYEL